jgi:hypothetical protein
VRLVELYTCASWHGITCGELLASLSSVAQQPAGDEGEAFFWIDIFAVAQNNTPHDDLAFEKVIAGTGRTVAVMHPWATPVMLGRAWCLHELEVRFLTRVCALLNAPCALCHAQVHHIWSMCTMPGIVTPS